MHCREQGEADMYFKDKSKHIRTFETLNKISDRVINYWFLERPVATIPCIYPGREQTEQYLQTTERN
jgi:hypothetical protein